MGASSRQHIDAAQQVSTLRSGDDLIIKVDGHFGFSVHKEFRSAYEEALKNAPPRRYVIDLKLTDYMDSSALGMLLVMRDHVGEQAEISLVNANSEIRSILDISNFHKIFNVA
jgi:anti-anti-sigma factor